MSGVTGYFLCLALAAAAVILALAGSWLPCAAAAFTAFAVFAFWPADVSK